MTMFRSAAALLLLAAAMPALAVPHVMTTQKPAAGLYEIVFNPADSRLYVASTGTRGGAPARIVALDAKTLAKVGEIDVAASPVFGLGINTRTQTLYGTDTRGGSVVAADIRTGKVTVLKADGGANAHLREVAIDEGANRIYATAVGVGGREPGMAAAPNQLWVIDGATNKVERTINVDTQMLTGLALDTRGRRAFVTGTAANEVLAIDLATDKVAARWPSGGEGPINLAYDAGGDRLFVANQKSGELTVLDAKTGAVKAKLPAGEGALGVAFNPGNNHAYVANRTAGTVTVVDAKDYKVLANLNTGTFPQTIAVDRRSNNVYVTNKARGLPRGSAPGTPVPEDPAGDTVALIMP